MENKKRVYIFQKKSNEYDLIKNFTSLDCDIKEFENFDDFLSFDIYSNISSMEEVMILIDGKTFIEWDQKYKEKFTNIYKNANIVLMADFSESYLFSKALLEKSCKEFIITPFGKKEAENLFKRVYFNGK